MKLRFWQILVLTIAVSAGVYFLGYINGHRGHIPPSYTPTIDSTSHYKTVINNLTTYVAERNQELMSEKQARKKDIIEKEALRKLNMKYANELSKVWLGVDTLIEDIENNGQVVDVLNSQIVNYKSEIDSLKRGKAILLPFEFRKTDPWLSLTGKFDINGRLSQEISLKANIDLWTGLDKKTKLNKAVLTTDCPYLDINLRSYKFDTPKEKKYNVSLFIGYGVTKDLHTTPVVGIGIGRTILKF